MKVLFCLHYSPKKLGNCDFADLLRLKGFLGARTPGRGILGPGRETRTSAGLSSSPRHICNTGMQLTVPATWLVAPEDNKAAESRQPGLN